MTVPATLSLPAHFDRRFQFWHFQPALDLLLIRSNKHTDPLMSPPQETRIDIRFTGVTDIRLARQMHGIRIGIVDHDDPRTAELGVEAALDRYVFSVEADDYPYGYVLATGISITEDDGLHEDAYASAES